MSEAVYRPFGAYRLALALLVVVSHSMPLATGEAHVLHRAGLGNVAVLSFFILSGLIIAEAIDRFYMQRLGAFLANRLYRLYPPYLAALAFAVMARIVVGEPASLRDVTTNILAIIPYANNNFLHTALTAEYVHFIWAIRAEFLFYIIFAAFRFMYFSLPAYFHEFYSFSIFVLLLVIHVWATYFITLPISISFYAQFFPYFMLGVALYYRRQRILGWVAASACVAHFTFYITQRAAPLSETWFERADDPAFAIAMLAMAASVAALIILRDTPMASESISRDKALGDFSYPIYISHSSALLLVATLATSRSLAWPLAVAALAAMLSVLILRFVDEPMRNRRARLRGTVL